MKDLLNEKIYILWAAGIILCVALALFCVFFLAVRPADSASPFTDSAQVAADSEPALTGSTVPDTEADCLLPETEDRGSLYQSRLVFAGDITTYDLEYYYAITDASRILVPDDGNLTLQNYTTAQINYADSGEYLTLPQAIAKKQPDILVLTLGRNDASLTESAFKELYSALLADVRASSPATVILCQSVLPVEAFYPEVTNEDIDRVNAWIIEVCTQQGCYYLNTAEALKTTDGALSSDYSAGDGVQISALGCSAVLSYIRSHAIPEA